MLTSNEYLHLKLIIYEWILLEHVEIVENAHIDIH